MNEPASQALAITETSRPKPSNFGSGVVPLIPQDFESAWRYAEMILMGGLAPKGMDTKEKVVAAILVGAELGLSPINALQNIAVINGRPAVWGDAQLGIVQASGLIEDFEETYEGEPFADDFRAVCRAKRSDRPTAIVRSYSVAEAKLAGLWDKRSKYGDPTPWVTNPKRMLQMRARAYALRDGFADVLKGLYSREELIGEPIDVTPTESVASVAELNQTYLAPSTAAAAEQNPAKLNGADKLHTEPASAAAPSPEPVSSKAPAEEEAGAAETSLIGRDAPYATMSGKDLKTAVRQTLETLNDFEADDAAGRLGFWADISGAALMLAVGRKGMTAEKKRLEAAVPAKA